MNEFEHDAAPADDSGTGGRLHEALTGAAAGVQPAEGSLGRVLARANQPSRWSWGAPVLAAAAALVVVAGVVAVVEANRSSGGAVAGSSSSGLPSSSVSESPSATTSTPSSSPTGTSTAPAGTVHALPVYYAGQSGGRATLFREFHSVRTAQPAADAVRQLLSVPPVDPDYQTLWPSGATLVSYATSGTVADVRVSGPPDQFPLAAFQQVVYSVTAADPALTAVRISYGSITLDPITRGDPSIYLAPVWVLTPAQGQSVHSPVTISGTASVFEATVSWQVTRPDGTRVAAGSAMASIGAPGRGLWSASVKLAPGTYVVTGFEISMKDGTWQWADTKTFTVH